MAPGLPLELNRVVNQTGWICIQLTQYNVMGAITNVLKTSGSLRLEVVDENRRMNDKNTKGGQWQMDNNEQC